MREFFYQPRPHRISVLESQSGVGRKESAEKSQPELREFFHQPRPHRISVLESQCDIDAMK